MLQTTLVGIVLYFLCNSVLTASLHATKGSVAEMLSVPIQQFALTYNRENLSPEDKEELTYYISEDTLSLYNGFISDPVKDGFNEEAFSERTKNFFYHYMIRDDSIMRQKDQRRNAVDLYSTCCEHEVRFRKIEDTELQELLLDSLVKSYLSLFQGAKLYKYGKEYIHKDFCLRNAYTVKTKLKSALFNFSPRLYWHVNAMTKKGI